MKAVNVDSKIPAGPVGLQEEEGDTDMCLLCGSKVISEEYGPEKGLSWNLKLFFLLRNLLQVPDTQLERNLEEWGNPENWIRLCEQCSELTRKGEKLYRQIMKIDKELRSIRNVIVNKIRSVDHHDDDEVLEKADNKDLINRRGVWRKTREFVTNYDYKGSIVAGNPFPEGDKRAATLANQLQKRISLSNPGNHGNSDDDDDMSVSIKQESDALEEPDNSDDKEEGFDDKEWCDEDEDWEPEPTKKVASSTRSRTRRPPIIIDGKYKCHYCDKLFNSPQTCHKHEQKKHFSLTPGQFPCDICGKLNNSLSFLTEHKRAAHKIKADGTPVPITNRRRPPPKTNRRPRRPPIIIDGKYKCHHCDQLFNSPQTCHKHEQKMHFSLTPGQFPCDICGKLKNSLGFLTEHKRSAHHIKADGTPVPKRSPSTSKIHKIKPDVTLDTTTTTKKHLKSSSSKSTVHSNNRKSKKVMVDVLKEPQTCEMCGKSYASKVSLQNHVRFVHDKRFKCYCHLCGMGFYSSPAMQRHLLSMHKDDKEVERMMEEEGARIWKCEVVGCSTKFMKEKGLEEHYKNVHSGNGGDKDANELKRYTCSFCGKGFWRPGQLKEHELVHKNAEVKPYSCDICGVAMATRNYLRNHRRSVHKIYKPKFMDEIV